MQTKTKRILSTVGILLLLVLGILAVLLFSADAVHASGLLDDTADGSNLYSRYGIDNYQLDFYVDTSWGWLPWNWKSGIGKQVMYGLYCLTNVLWTLSLYLSSATGYLVQQAFKLDIINDMADMIGNGIQTLAGVNAGGIMSEGFYPGFLLLLILILGVYVTYTGLVKQETSKAVQAAVNFIVIFLLSVAFIGYAPSYIRTINELSTDVSTAALSLGTKITMAGQAAEGDSTDLLRDNLFSIQVYQPWLLLQFDTTDVDAIGTERIEALLSVSPEEETPDGKNARDDVVKEEIETNHNKNLTPEKVMKRFGIVLFLFFINLGISAFVVFLSGIMILSQVLFIIYAMLLPISCLMAMIPGCQNHLKQAVVKVFNTVMMRAGISLVVVIAFSISTMLFSMSGTYPFFMVGVLQIITFAGIAMKLGDIMQMFSLQSNDGQQIGRRILRAPKQYVRRGVRRFERRLGRKLGLGFSGSRGSTNRKPASKTAGAFQTGNQRPGSRGAKTRNPEGMPAGQKNLGKTAETDTKRTLGKTAGIRAATIVDAPARAADKARKIKENVKNAPVNAGYTVHKNVSDLKNKLRTEPKERQQIRTEQLLQQKQDVADKKAELTGARGKRLEKKKQSAHQRPAAPVRKTTLRGKNSPENELGNIPESASINGVCMSHSTHKQRPDKRKKLKGRPQNELGKISRSAAVNGQRVGSTHTIPNPTAGKGLVQKKLVIRAADRTPRIQNQNLNLHPAVRKGVPKNMGKKGRRHV